MSFSDIVGGGTSKLGGMGGIAIGSWFSWSTPVVLLGCKLLRSTLALKVAVDEIFALDLINSFRYWYCLFAFQIHSWHMVRYLWMYHGVIDETFIVFNFIVILVKNVAFYYWGTQFWLQTPPFYCPVLAFILCIKRYVIGNPISFLNFKTFPV